MMHGLVVLTRASPYVHDCVVSHGWSSRECVQEKHGSHHLKVETGQADGLMSSLRLHPVSLHVSVDRYGRYADCCADVDDVCSAVCATVILDQNESSHSDTGTHDSSSNDLFCHSPHYYGHGHWV